MNKRLSAICLLAALAFHQASAQSLRHRVDSLLSLRYHKGNIDTAYITRPATKWTVTARLNVSGAKIEAKGIENGLHFNSEMKADYKSTISLAVSYLGFSLSAALNPAKLMGKYRDFELNFNGNDILVDS